MTSNIASLGRFSSQMLAYLGTQRTVKNVSGSVSNIFKYSTGNAIFPEPGSVQQSNTRGVSGAWPINYFVSTKSFFLSRGATEVYADTMTALTLDIASILGVTPQSLLEKSEFVGKLKLEPNAYLIFNSLRDPSHQVGSLSPVNNRKSMQAREIRG